MYPTSVSVRTRMLMEISDRYGRTPPHWNEAQRSTVNVWSVGLETQTLMFYPACVWYFPCHHRHFPSLSPRCFFMPLWVSDNHPSCLQMTIQCSFDAKLFEPHSVVLAQSEPHILGQEWYQPDPSRVLPLLNSLWAGVAGVKWLLGSSYI